MSFQSMHRALKGLAFCAAIVIASFMAAAPASAQIIAKVDVSRQSMNVTVNGRHYATWKVSTGRRGYRTPRGTYRPKWLARMHYSRKYDMSPMPHSIFFHGGYAIHGTTEIRRLGRPVSHGCVRVSREDAEFLYNKIKKGTPVLVHKGKSAVKIAFGRLGDVHKYYAYSKIYRLLPRRYKLIYDGDYFITLKDKLVIDEDNVGHNGLPIGKSDLIPFKQRIKPSILWVDDSLSEEKRLNEILTGRENHLLSYNPFLDFNN